MTTGTVYLVGAGPGDPGLITIRGVECLRRADVVVYDRLVSPDLLRYAKTDTELFYVGKESSRHTLSQGEINALLVNRAKSGMTVCRLKGGDPFVFGRGAEEAEACRKAGVAFEIVPGVTSAIAAPAYAGIPITHRDSASSFAVITGHERDDADDLGWEPGSADGKRDWAKIAQAADTLVFLMGVENIDEIASRLVENGREPETPVALVRWGTCPKQETLISTLAQVADEVRQTGFTPPAVTVVGDVVRLRERLRWFDNRPLFGKRILVTRAREQASWLSDLLRDHGADPVEFPVIRIREIDDYTELDSALERLPEYSWILFTSVNAVKVVQRRLKSAGQDARAFAEVRIAAVGRSTAEALRGMGLIADFVPSNYVAECAAEEWPDTDMKGKRVLLPRAKQARDILPDGLRKMGAQVDIVTAYENVMDAEAADSVREELLTGSIDAITFASSSTVTNFVESIGPAHMSAIESKVIVASIGPITSETARQLGLPPDVEAKDHSIPGLVSAFVDHYGKMQKENVRGESRDQ